ncbi:threonine dehydratase, partial [[Emmonsia] crescens]
MTDSSHWLPLTTSNVLAAHALIKPYIHETPILTSKTLNRIASTPRTPEALVGTPFEGQPPAQPKINFFFKCENFQRIGAFKPRGAFHALLRIVEVLGEEEVRKRGVVTHSSGNHAQALALAASTLSIPAYIIMPSISTPSKIDGTRSLGAKVIFS